MPVTRETLVTTASYLPQYPELERGYQYGGGRRQDVLQGQFVDVRQQQQLEGEAELLEDSPVPVVIRGHHHIRLV